MINPEIYTFETKRTWINDLHCPYISGYLFLEPDDPKYSSKVTELLQVWFLNNDTRINPHLKYAEIVRGKDKTYPALSWLEET